MSIAERTTGVEAAQSQVDAARGRLMATVEEIQQRIAPSTLMDEALDQVRSRSTELAQSAGRIARERPATVVATAAGIGAVLARRPLARLAARIFGRKQETPAPKRRSSRKPASEG